MSFTFSSRGSTPCASPAISISSRGSSVSSTSSTSRAMPSYSSPQHALYSSCAYPSWQNKSPCHKQSAGLYVSDEDLFGGDYPQYMDEAPEPPRTAEEWLAPVAPMARPLLPPVRPKPKRVHTTTSKRGSRSSHSSKPSKG